MILLTNHGETSVGFVIVVKQHSDINRYHSNALICSISETNWQYTYNAHRL